MNKYVFSCNKKQEHVFNCHEVIITTYRSVMSAEQEGINFFIFVFLEFYRILFKY